MSESNVYTAGLHNAGSYIVSGKPWITGSTANTNSLAANNQVKIEFPYERIGNIIYFFLKMILILMMR